MANEWDWGKIDTGTPTDATRREPEGWSESAYKKQEANLARKSLGGLSRNQAMGSGLSHLSGMFSRGDPGKFPEEDLAYHEGLRKDVWQKTTPDVHGVGFQTKWRQKADGTWELTSELDEEGKAIRDDAYTRQKMFLDQASTLGSGGWKMPCKKDSTKKEHFMLVKMQEKKL